LQVRLVNSAMLPFAELQFAFDLACERFHVATQMWSDGIMARSFAVRQSKKV
jgi:hypothetical protein